MRCILLTHLLLINNFVAITKRVNVTVSDRHQTRMHMCATLSV